MLINSLYINVYQKMSCLVKIDSSIICPTLLRTEHTHSFLFLSGSVAIMRGCPWVLISIVIIITVSESKHKLHGCEQGCKLECKMGYYILNRTDINMYKTCGDYILSLDKFRKVWTQALFKNYTLILTFF